MRAIVNITPQWGIGFEHQLLTHIHADMRRFRMLTQHNTIIVGRKTLSTFPNGAPLKNRENIIMTRNPDFRAEGGIPCPDLDMLRNLIAGRDPDTVFVCGGEHIYRLLLPYCDSALVTLSYIDAKADRFFPNLNLQPQWNLTDVGDKQTEDGVAFRFLEYRNTDPIVL